jgi:hypothetical protein
MKNSCSVILLAPSCTPSIPIPCLRLPISSRGTFVSTPVRLHRTVGLVLKVPALSHPRLSAKVRMASSARLPKDLSFASSKPEPSLGNDGYLTLKAATRSLALPQRSRRRDWDPKKRANCRVTCGNYMADYYQALKATNGERR